jgi:serine protease
MRTARFLPVAVILAVVCFCQMGFGADNIYVQGPVTYSGPDFIPGQIIVKFRPGVSESAIGQINRANNASVVHRSEFADFRVLTFPETIAPQAMVNIYARNPNVEYAELNHIAYAAFVPNDQYYHYQWHLDNAKYGGIGMEEAWAISTGAGVIVAVVDTGISKAGQDLKNTSFVAGYDYVNNDNDPTDDNGHGTHVAGTIAQSTNNGIGVAGVAYGCSLMPVKVLNRNGSGTYAQIANGIYFAANNGAKVINMSLGGSSSSTTLQNAVAYAYNHGVTIVCAAGNDGASQVSYPARYDAYCIAVGATRYDETRAAYSNYGSSLDLCAPGGDTSVDQNGDGYGDGVLQETFQRNTWGYYFFQGTSMASPHVAGVAALVISRGVASSPDDVRHVLEVTAEDKGAAGWDNIYGWGIVDAYKAVTYSAVPNQPPTASFTWTASGLTCNLDASGSFDSDGTISSYAWDFGDGTTGAGMTTSHAYAAADDYTVTLTVTDDDNATGTCSKTVTVSQPAGNLPPTASFTATPDGLTCAFDASASKDSDGTISSYAWDFGDDTTGSGVTTDHVYAAGGTYLVILTVTDNAGATGTQSQSVTVSGPTGTLYATITEITFHERRAGKNIFVAAVANVKIRDKATGAPISEASVTGAWSGAVNSTSTGTTVDGVVTLTSAEVKVRSSAMFILDITGVALTGYTFDAEDGVPRASATWP